MHFSFSEPPVITSSGGDKEVGRGESFSLECKAKGSPKPTVEWTRNGERDPRQKVRTVHCKSNHHLVLHCNSNSAQ